MNNPIIPYSDTPIRRPQWLPITAVSAASKLSRPTITRRGQVVTRQRPTDHTRACPHREAQLNSPTPARALDADRPHAGARRYLKRDLTAPLATIQRRGIDAVRLREPSTTSIGLLTRLWQGETTAAVMSGHFSFLEVDFNVSRDR